MKLYVQNAEQSLQLSPSSGALVVSDQQEVYGATSDTTIYVDVYVRYGTTRTLIGDNVQVINVNADGTYAQTDTWSGRSAVNSLPANAEIEVSYVCSGGVSNGDATYPYTAPILYPTITSDNWSFYTKWSRNTYDYGDGYWDVYIALQTGTNGSYVDGVAFSGTMGSTLRLYPQYFTCNVPYGTPTYKGGWESTTYSYPIALSGYKRVSGGSFSSAESVSTNPYDVVVRQTQTMALLSAVDVTPASTFGIVGMYETDVAADGYMKVHAYVRDGASNTAVTGTLINEYVDSVELDSVSTSCGRTISPSGSQVSAKADDAIVVEIGWRATNTTTANKMVYFYCGKNSTDLEEDGNPATYPGWFEFTLEDPNGGATNSTTISGASTLKETRVSTVSGSSTLQQVRTDTLSGASVLSAVRNTTISGNSTLLKQNTTTIDGATALISLPDAPSDVTSVQSGVTIVVSWTDNSSNETGFVVERRWK